MSASTSSSIDHSRHRGAWGWYAAILGALLAVIGLMLALGGVYLISLGGSWYYAISGVLLIASGLMLIARYREGAWLYALTWLGTLVWAVWEVTLDGWQPDYDWWALVPRIVAPTVLLILVAIAWPALRRRQELRQPMRLAASVALAVVLVALGGGDGWAQTPQPGDATPAATAPADEADAAAETPDPAAEARPADDAQADTATTERQPDLLPPVGEDWPVYGGSEHALRHSPLDQINVDNVARLEKAWSFHTGDLPEGDTEGLYSPENTPIKVKDSLFVCSPMNQIIALDAGSGKEIWRYDPHVPADAIPYGATCRGVAYHVQPQADPDALCTERLVMGTLDARLIAVDANTGQLCTGFGNNGMVDLTEGLGRTVPGWYANTAAPTIVRGVVVMGAQVSDNEEADAPSGVIRGYDVVTGEFLWAWDLGQGGAVGEPAEGETYTRSTPNMWTNAAGDQELGYVYAPLGNASSDYWGPSRSEAENEYSSSLVAIDVRTGEDVWHFQTVHHDVWDYDLGSQVSLVDFPTADGTVPALILPSKQGQIYVLDRRTGESLFPVEEREVTTTGGAETDYMSPTQPYSTYAALTKPDLKETDMWGMSPIDQMWCRIQYHRAHYTGQFTPPSADRPFIQYPGYNGGSDWGSASVDPERGILLMNYNDMPNYTQLVPREEAEQKGVSSFSPDNGKYAAMKGSPYAAWVNAGWRVPGTGLLCKQPPYGWIRGIDLSTGETLWDHPFGSARNNGPFGIPSGLPFTIGTPNNGGPITTGGGLTFIAATTDNRFRAFDTETGEELWAVDLPAGGQTTPISYGAGGRQYVVIYPGGHHFMETEVGDEVIAYALPEQ